MEGVRHRGHSSLERFLFADRSLVGLGLYRIVFCALVALEAIRWLPYSSELFSMESYHQPYLYSLRITSLESSLMCALLILTSLLASLGYFTRFHLCLTLVLFSALHGVDQIAEKAVETIIIVVLAILIMSPCGHVLSVDNWMQERPRLLKTTIFWQRLLQFHFAQIYFFAGVTKITVPEWPTGAVALQSMHGRWGSEFGVWLSGLLPDVCVRALGLGTILFELLIGFFLFQPKTNRAAVGCALLFHLGIELTMNVGTLGLHFLAADLFVLLAPEHWKNAEESLRRYLGTICGWVHERAFPLAGYQSIFGPVRRAIPDAELKESP